ncbi:MAG: hypothetical protein V2A58_18015 [Planctomycetota bacterium]
METETDGGWLVWDVALGPGEGRIFAVRPTPIGNVRVEAPTTVEKGNKADVVVTIEDDRGVALAGLLPVQVTIRDSQGDKNDYSDYYLARDGTVRVPIRIARNDPSGAWEVSARDLIAGKEGMTTVTCRRPDVTNVTDELERDAVIIMPTEGIPLDLWGVPVGTKKNLVFRLPVETAQVKAAFLLLTVDDIDEPKEATIVLNGKASIKVEGSVLGEGAGYPGRLDVPVDALVEGVNTFEFTFADNLDNATQGYVIMDAALMILKAE